MLLSPPAPLGFSGPKQLRQLVDFAYQCALDRRPFADAEDASEGLRWSSGPAGRRASQVLLQAQRRRYRDGQNSNARAELSVFFADNPCGDIESACIAAACATEAQDGDWSTLITADDIVALIAEHRQIDSCKDVLELAEMALADFHVGWSDPTPECERARAESVAEVEAWLASRVDAPDPFDPAQRSPLPATDPAAEAASRQERERQGEAWSTRMEARATKRREREELEQIKLESRIECWTREDSFWAREEGPLRSASTEEVGLPVVAAETTQRHNPETGVLDLARRLATIDFDPNAEFTPPSWLAKGLLPRKGIGLLFGESGAGKSFAAIHAALCVAWGQPLFESKVKQGGVLYVAAEGGSSVAGRFRAANDAMQAQIAAARLSGDQPKRAPIRIVTETPDLSRDGDPKALLRTITDAAHDFEKAGYPLALVVVDTWHAAMGGGDENSAADAGAALKPLRDATETGGFHCLIVHHPGKDSERGARGSNALPAAADAIIAVTVPGFEGAKAKPSDAMRRATITKMRDGEAGGEFCYRLPIVEMGIDEDGDPITTCRVEPCHPPKLDDAGLSKTDKELMAVVRDAIDEAGGDRAGAEEARLRFYAGRPDAKESTRRMAWQRTLRRAIEDGRIETDEHSLFLWFPGASDEGAEP